MVSFFSLILGFPIIFTAAISSWRFWKYYSIFYFRVFEVSDHFYCLHLITPRCCFFVYMWGGNYQNISSTIILWSESPLWSHSAFTYLYWFAIKGATENKVELKGTAILMTHWEWILESTQDFPYLFSKFIGTSAQKCTEFAD